jgi:dTDP-4-dehydrorhamnose reductase
MLMQGNGVAMRIVVTGANGQLGRAVVARFQAHHDVIPLGHADIELSDVASVAQIVALRPAAIIHAAAMTNVDGCAQDPDSAYRVNALGARWVAMAAKRSHARLVLISTNEVFDGQATYPYGEFDVANPINPYARSKYAGEQAARELIDRLYIVRVAWLFGGPRNFVRTILRLASTQPQLRVVHDEVGSPTHAGDVATLLPDLLESNAYGTYHLVNEGACSRYELARAVLDAAGLNHIETTPITLAEYPRPSRVPPYTPLANYVGSAMGLRLRPWQEAVTEFVYECRKEQA